MIGRAYFIRRVEQIREFEAYLASIPSNPSEAEADRWEDMFASLWNLSGLLGIPPDTFQAFLRAHLAR